MKRVLRRAVFCVMIMAMVVSCLPASIQAAGKRVDFNSIEGKHCSLGEISKITFKGNKVTIVGTFYDNDWNESSKKKVTYKIAKKLNYYEIEDAAYYHGKVKNTKFRKQCKTYLKDKFPMVQLWIKNGKIVSYATSA